VKNILKSQGMFILANIGVFSLFKASGGINI